MVLNKLEMLILLWQIVEQRFKFEEVNMLVEEYHVRQDNFSSLWNST
jgi:hypothetical protein